MVRNKRKSYRIIQKLRKVIRNKIIDIKGKEIQTLSIKLISLKIITEQMIHRFHILLQKFLKVLNLCEVNEFQGKRKDPTGIPVKNSNYQK